ncbi:hypothetical protein ABZR86_02460 [Dyella marensis]|uniref:Uncharacterized protein n=1 Tax=Dyella marensis TaxID=500610 RepID=A0A1I2A0L1_9GAMM|nr:MULTISPECIES: hypothetical protein [Dyella]SFE37495.1 hypothetical protein SAMN02799615_00882 [Dyella marensis]
MNAHLRRLRTIQNASLVLILLVSLLIGLMSLSLAAVTALYGLSIGASIVGGAAILAHWRADVARLAARKPTGSQGEGI